MYETEPEEVPVKKQVEEEETPSIPAAPVYESFHTTNLINNDYGVKKARFNVLDENQQTDVYSEEMSKAIFEEPKAEIKEVVSRETEETKKTVKRAGKKSKKIDTKK